MKTRHETKYKKVLAAVKNGIPVGHALKQFKVSAPAGYYAWKRAKGEGTPVSQKSQVKRKKQPKPFVQDIPIVAPDSNDKIFCFFGTVTDMRKLLKEIM